MHNTYAFAHAGRSYALDARLDAEGFSLSATCGGQPVPAAQAVRMASGSLRGVLDRLLLLDGCDADGVPRSPEGREASLDALRRRVVDAIAAGRIDAADRLLGSAVSTLEIEDVDARAEGALKRIFQKSRKDALASAAESLYASAVSAKDAILPMFALRSMRSALAALSRQLGDDFEHCGFPDVSTTPRDRKGIDGLASAVARQAVFFNAGIMGRGPREYLRTTIRRNVVTHMVDARIMPVAVAQWQERAAEAARILSTPASSVAQSAVPSDSAITVERIDAAGRQPDRPSFDGMLAAVAEEAPAPSMRA